MQNRDFDTGYNKNPTGYSTRPSYRMHKDPDLKHDHIFGQFRSGAQDLKKGLFGTFGMPEPIKRGKAFGSGGRQKKIGPMSVNDAKSSDTGIHPNKFNKPAVLGGQTMDQIQPKVQK